MVVNTQRFDLCAEEFSHPLRDIRFAGWRDGVVLREPTIDEPLFAHLPPSLRNPAAATKRLRNQRVFLFLRQLRCGSSWVSLSPICNCGRNAATNDPPFKFSIELKSDSFA